ncbi:hypothetical protein [Paracoccus zhejiangensis]|uniref:Uncharacterized protein n=1 Tax=Paracoccus zhejiangensis TaxID=1077935 RepID=A0A2H5F1A5_9RHOB|nr:hypothetical protein [Paracoccus zhejiangensis]AUH65307.1 hypothetical protein CX676_14980 [Paracoccus zhejiangensis]
MRRWMCSLLVGLFALGVMMQHGQSVRAADMPVHDIAALMAAAANDAAWPDDPSYRASAAGMSDGCPNTCTVAPLPWDIALQVSPMDSATTMKRQFRTARQEGRLVSPGYRPPRPV